MKKLTVVVCIFLMLGSMAFAQGSDEGSGKSNLRVGMVTDA
ncbi:MAG: BMP family ABC transporter substrate-binding protein, partial [Spirochaetia bacterium]|nr:BMP family ABC transporter substrate-binding protein [Spirochaetia bacterium]